MIWIVYSAELFVLEVMLAWLLLLSQLSIDWYLAPTNKSEIRGEKVLIVEEMVSFLFLGTIEAYS